MELTPTERRTEKIVAFCARASAIGLTIVIWAVAVSALFGLMLLSRAL